MGGYAVSINWRWPLYEAVILGGIVLLFLPFPPRDLTTDDPPQSRQTTEEGLGQQCLQGPLRDETPPF